MTSIRERIEELYAQVVSRLDGDPQEGKALLDELLLLLAKAANAKGHGEEKEVLERKHMATLMTVKLANAFTDSPPRSGRRQTPWREVADLWLQVEQLRKPPTRLSTTKALEKIALSRLSNSGKSVYNKEARTKAMRWVKTKKTQLSTYRSTLRVASEILSRKNI